MKLAKLTLTAMSLLVLLVSNACASASHRQVNGMIIGGGTGALVGQAIGNNTESTLVGATVGGVLGLIVGSEIDRNHHRGYRPPHVSVHFRGEHHHRDNYRKRNYRHYDRRDRYYDRRPVYREQRRHGHNRHNVGRDHHRKNCREVTTVRHGRHGSTRIVRSSCGHNGHKVWKKKGHRRY